MAEVFYLSAPYSSADASLRDWRAEVTSQAMRLMAARGQIVICPLVMNHAAFGEADTEGPDGAYWREIEHRLAATCDRLTVLKLPNWRESRGVRREISLFESLNKPIDYMDCGPGLEIHS